MKQILLLALGVTLLASSLVAQSRKTVPLGPAVVRTENTYHVLAAPDCPAAADIFPWIFTTASTALRLGLKPCPICKPNERRDIKKFISDYGATVADELISYPGPFSRVSEGRANEIRVTARSRANGNPDAFRAAYSSALKIAAPTYSPEPFVITGLQELKPVISGPAYEYGELSAEALRKMEPLESVTWPRGVSIFILPTRIDSADIEKIVVTRDGQSVAPLVDELKAQELATPMGAKVTIHQGRQIYPVEAFSPGGLVIVTFIPATGKNVARYFTDIELRQIQ